MAWWQQLKESRRQENKPRINTWERFTKTYAQWFLTIQLWTKLVQQFTNLRQGTHNWWICYEILLYDRNDDIGWNRKTTYLSLHWRTTCVTTSHLGIIQPGFCVGGSPTYHLYGNPTLIFLELNPAWHRGKPYLRLSYTTYWSYQIGTEHIHHRQLLASSYQFPLFLLLWRMRSVTNNTPQANKTRSCHPGNRWWGTTIQWLWWRTWYNNRRITWRYMSQFGPSSQLSPPESIARVVAV